jgi:hypothetical protein
MEITVLAKPQLATDRCSSKSHAKDSQKDYMELCVITRLSVMKLRCNYIGLLVDRHVHTHLVSKAKTKLLTS